MTYYALCGMLNTSHTDTILKSRTVNNTYIMSQKMQKNTVLLLRLLEGAKYGIDLTIMFHL